MSCAERSTKDERFLSCASWSPWKFDWLKFGTVELYGGDFTVTASLPTWSSRVVFSKVLSGFKQLATTITWLVSFLLGKLLIELLRFPSETDSFPAELSHSLISCGALYFATIWFLPASKCRVYVLSRILRLKLSFPLFLQTSLSSGVHRSRFSLAIIISWGHVLSFNNIKNRFLLIKP